MRGPLRIDDIEQLAAQHGARVSGAEIVLYAGTNLMSARAAAMLATPLGLMPAMGRGVAREQPGVGEIVAIEAAAEAMACRLFSGGWAELRLASCTLANLAVYAACCSPGSRIAATPRRAGGHVSHHEPGPPGLLGLEVVDLPYDEETQAPDDVAGADLIGRIRPTLIVLGASFMPRLYSFKRIRAAATAVGAVILYDIAHVAGLVAGKSFANPLDQGADLLTASTYKSLGGPPGGVVIGRNSELESRVRRVAYPGLTANYDASRVAALAISLTEMETHAGHYARAMLANASALEDALVKEGVDVIRSSTHHIGLPLGSESEARAGMAALQDVGILCGVSAMLAHGASHGLRIGTQLITRRGFVPQDMAPLARLFVGALRRDDPRNLREGVARLARSRPELHFCEPCKVRAAAV
jgi:glycine hydroxymethyltransferase